MLLGQEPEKDPVEISFDEIRKYSRSGSHDDAVAAARLLDGVETEKLNDTQRDTWVSLARDNALQLGDLERLKRLAEIKTTFPADRIYEVLLAYGKLTRAQLEQASEILDKIDSSELNPREERRVFALRAKIAKINGDKEQERVYIEKMIEHLPFWPDSNCQSCHNDLKNPDRMTAINFSELWFGIRYAELMKEKGDAASVRADAEKMLKSDPEDVMALIQLGYALKANGDQEGAKKAFERIPFSKESNQELSAARMLFAFP